MNKIKYWLIQFPCIILAVLGGREIGVYSQATDELNQLKTHKIEELEKDQRNQDEITKVTKRIEHLESSDYFDRSLHKGMIFIAIGFLVPVITNRYFERKKKGEPDIAHNAGKRSPLS